MVDSTWYQVPVPGIPVAMKPGTCTNVSSYRSMTWYLYILVPAPSGHILALFIAELIDRSLSRDTWRDFFTAVEKKQNVLMVQVDG
jgi:hypothetical protein